MIEDFSLSGDWQARIAQSFADLTSGQKRIADHVLRKPMDLAFMTAQQLAAETGVSEASIVRFARAIGYAGYPPLQQEVQQAIGHAFSPVERLEQMEQSQSGPSLDDGLSRTIRGDIESLSRADEHINRQDFLRAVHLLSEATTVHIVGTRGLAAPAHLAYHFLSQIRPDVHLVSAHLDRFGDDLNRLSSQSMILAFDFGRYNRRTLMAVKFARHRGASIVTIADSIDAPTTRFADHVLLVTPFTLGFFQSHTAAVSVVSALVSEVAMLNRDRTVENLGLLEEALGAFDVFLNEGEAEDSQESDWSGDELT